MAAGLRVSNAFGGIPRETGSELKDRVRPLQRSSTMAMYPVGHSLAHRPQPLQ